jgi:5-methylcytosine-specific restriction protein A
MTGFPKVVRDIVTRRAGDHCERCGVDRPEQIHHRRPRGMGGSSARDTNTASNALFISGDCHRLIESDRDAAFDRGWLVRQGQNPADVPVIWQGDWALLTDDGTVFTPPQGSGRCPRCGFHTTTQGHRDGCQLRGTDGSP